MKKAKVAIIMGSRSDWPVMRHATTLLEEMGIEYDTAVVSAHRTPDRLCEFAKSAKDNYSVVIAGAGGAAHLPGMTAAMTCVPVIAVPVTSKALNGVDSLLSIVQMPKGIPVATFAIGEAGAANAALFAIAQLAIHDTQLAAKLEQFRKNQHQAVLDMTLPPLA